MTFLSWLMRSMTPPQILASGFLIVITTGTALLMLPVSVTSPISIIDALFTAASATTVTGLVTISPGNGFTVFGQTVIMVMIQLGGLGFMAVTVFIVLLLGKRIGLRSRLLVQESLNQPAMGGVVKLVKILVIFSLSVESLAAAALATQWVPEYGWGEGLFYSVFHAVSAFNNAGFSLWDSNLMQYAGNPAVNIAISSSFIIGGIGFTVLYDVWEKRKFRTLTLHSKLMIVGTLVLNVAAVTIVFLFEYINPQTVTALTLGEQLWTSYFQAVSPRTAGFNTVNIADMQIQTIVFIMMLMFIGAGSASTASGIKLTTFLVIILAAVKYIKREEDLTVFHRRIAPAIIERALAITVLGFAVVFSGIFILSLTEQASFEYIVFEVFSAFGTVGLTMGLTESLSTIGKVVIIGIMFVGRVGSVTLAFSLAKPKKTHVRYPRGDIFTG
ncbi:TrkH family potassium uptake protein [Marinococcus luteus]|nr:TrkH family potassium uptake protein [Marinococcus luteus]